MLACIRLITTSKIRYRVKLHQTTTIRLQVIDTFLSRSKVKVKCDQNRISSRIHHNTYS